MALNYNEIKATLSLTTVEWVRPNHPFRIQANFWAYS